MNDLHSRECETQDVVPPARINMRVQFAVCSFVACIVLTVVCIRTFRQEHSPPPFVSALMPMTWSKYAFMALFFGIVAGALGFGQRWRFSLRTLLIVTTLVAVALGLILWAVR